MPPLKREQKIPPAGIDHAAPRVRAPREHTGGQVEIGLPGQTVG